MGEERACMRRRQCFAGFPYSYKNGIVSSLLLESRGDNDSDQWHIAIMDGRSSVQYNDPLALENETAGCILSMM
jgi:hypothetical protein